VIPRTHNQIRRAAQGVLWRRLRGGGGQSAGQGDGALVRRGGL